MMILCLSDMFCDSATKERTFFCICMKCHEVIFLCNNSFVYFTCICTYKLYTKWYNIYRAYVFVSPKVIKMLYLQKMEFTLGEESEKPSKKELTDEELSKHLDRLLEEKANNQRIYDWAEVSVRALVVI